MILMVGGLAFLSFAPWVALAVVVLLDHGGRVATAS